MQAGYGTYEGIEAGETDAEAWGEYATMAAFAVQTCARSTPSRLGDAPSRLHEEGNPWYDGEGRPVCNCFPARTLVATAEGKKPIERIAVGDWV